MEVRSDLDPESRAVLGDWLCASGDPRGELINLELRLEHLSQTPALATDNERAELRTQVEGLRVELESGWLEELAQTMSMTPALIRALLPGRWYAGLLLELAPRLPPPLSKGGWRLECEVSERLLAWLLGSDLAVALEVLDARELRSGPVLSMLAERPRPRLRSLSVGGRSGHEPRSPLARLDGSLPALTHLRVAASRVEFGGWHAPTLRRLHVEEGGVLIGLDEALSRSTWPVLEALTLHQTDMQSRTRQHVSPTKLVATLRPEPLPALRELALIGTNLDAELVEALAEAPLLGQLRRLCLSDARIDTHGVRALRDRADAFAHLVALEAFELEFIDIDAGMRASLTQALPTLDLGSV